MADIQTPYLNLQTDFGFKFVFGSLHNKRALVRFLKELPGRWEDCRTDIEQALFLIKNIDKNPKSISANQIEI